jgi:hypothetical protein
MSISSDQPKPKRSAIDLHPSLLEVVEKEGLNSQDLNVGFQVRLKEGILDHHHVFVISEQKAALWFVPSLRDLFRGDRIPPSFADGPDNDYAPLFLLVEVHAIEFCAQAGNKTDAEFEEAYNNLRRRPDGKPLSQLQDYLWQAAALLAGRHPISAAEFDAIFGRLARSARTLRDGYSSRNYIDVLQRMAAGDLG